MATIIRLTISYTLAEYLSFVRDHLPALLARRAGGKTYKPPGVLSRALIVAGASLSFLSKKCKMPICDFLITDEYVRRTTNSGELLVPWSDVRAVHRYSQGFLVEKANGGLPLPYRCFSESERTEFERLVAKHIA
jgi:hypothetical protein